MNKGWNPAAAIDFDSSPAASAQTANIGCQPDRIFAVRDMTMCVRHPMISSLVWSEPVMPIRSTNGFRNSRWNANFRSSPFSRRHLSNGSTGVERYVATIQWPIRPETMMATSRNPRNSGDVMTTISLFPSSPSTKSTEK